jgi:hypothetical protein
MRRSRAEYNKTTPKIPCPAGNMKPTEDFNQGHGEIKLTF